MGLEFRLFKDAMSQIRQLRIDEEQLLTDDLHCQWANSKKEKPTKDMAQRGPTLPREKGFTTSICGQQSQVFLGKDGSVMCVCVCFVGSKTSKLVNENRSNENYGTNKCSVRILFT